MAIGGFVTQGIGGGATISQFLLLGLSPNPIAAITFDPTVAILRGYDSETNREHLRGYDSEANRDYLSGRDTEAAPPILRGRV